MNIARTEWLKIKNYPAFWWVIGITALSYPGINYIMFNAYEALTQQKDMTAEMAKMLLGNPFALPEAWHTVAYFSSIFIFIPAIVVIMLITNEYTYKTHRQNIIEGWSRQQFMLGKFIDVVIIAALITVLYIAVTLIIGSVNTSVVEAKESKLHFIGLFALQTFSQLSLAFAIGFLLRKSFIALAIFIFYYLILEPIGVQVMKIKANDMGRFLPLELSDRMIPPPGFYARFSKGYDAALAAMNTHVVYTLIFTAALWAFCFWLNKKRDL